MKIFFTASLHGRQQYEAQYQRIVELAEQAGHTVVSDHVLKQTLENTKQLSSEAGVEQYHSLLEEMKISDVVIAELSYPSATVGYVVSQAISQGKPVAILFSGDVLPHLFRTLEAINEKVTTSIYHELDDLDQEVEHVLEFLAQAQDVRFNFFITPDLSSYLDWMAKNKREPRAVFLRRLLDEDIAKNPEYKEDVE